MDKPLVLCGSLICILTEMIMTILYTMLTRVPDSTVSLKVYSIWNTEVITIIRKGMDYRLRGEMFYEASLFLYTESVICCLFFAKMT